MIFAQHATRSSKISSVSPHVEVLRMQLLQLGSDSRLKSVSPRVHGSTDEEIAFV